MSALIYRYIHFSFHERPNDCKVKKKQAIIEKDCHFPETGGAWRELKFVTLKRDLQLELVLQLTVQTTHVVQDIRYLTVQLLQSTNF